MKTATLTPVKPAKLEIDNAKIQRFSALIAAGIEAWSMAGRLLAEMMDSNQNTLAIIQRECPHLSLDTLLAFEKIGRRQINPYLLIDNCPGARHLLALPFALQDKYYKEKVDVLVGWERLKPIITSKLYQQMSKDEAVRVFTSKGARSIEEQKELFPPPESQYSRKEPQRRMGHMTTIGYYKLVQDKGTSVRLVKMDAPGEIGGTIEIERSQRGGIESLVFEVKMSDGLVEDAKEFEDVDESTKPAASSTDALFKQQIADKQVELRHAREDMSDANNSAGRKQCQKKIDRLEAEIKNPEALLDEPAPVAAKSGKEPEPDDIQAQIDQLEEDLDGIRDFLENATNDEARQNLKKTIVKIESQIEELEAKL